MRVLLVLLVLNVVGVGLYGSGFFLTRLEVTNTTGCHLSTSAEGGRNIDLFSPSLQQTVADRGCWATPKFRKVIWIMIDALRLDFVLSPHQTSQNEFYHGHFTLIKDLLSSPTTRQHSALFQFIADSPTVTMQRLKALTTGSIPTFIDINDVKFESSTVKEDNLIDQ